jgi:hypothetical protein
MNLKEYFPEEELDDAEKFIQEFHGKILLDGSISNPNAIILSTYMLSNKEKSPSIEKKRVRELFISFGRKAEEFDKAIYEVSGKRKGKKPFVNIDKEFIGISFNGLKKIKDVLRGINDE